MKYTASVSRAAFGDFEFLGKISADSIKELKAEARRQARQNNKHGQRLILETECGLVFRINS